MNAKPLPPLQAQELQQFIQNALYEDVREGDHSAMACIPRESQGRAQLLIKEDTILAGMEVAEHIFAYVDPEIQFTSLLGEGERVKSGDIAFQVAGSSISILKAERLVLNCMQRMSAIAQLTQAYVAQLEGLHTKVLDTRKTTPGLRLLEKWAVRIGGGHNHRFGLYDMIMLKDNHIDFAGGIEAAIGKTLDYLKRTGLDLRIEVETRNLQEVEEVLSVGGIHRIMLDNFSYPDAKEAVKRIAGRFETEASGGINLETVREHAACGVDFVSVGALTHGVKNVDLSLKAY